MSAREPCLHAMFGTSSTTTRRPTLVALAELFASPICRCDARGKAAQRTTSLPQQKCPPRRLSHTPGSSWVTHTPSYLWHDRIQIDTHEHAAPPRPGRGLAGGRARGGGGGGGCRRRRPAGGSGGLRRWPPPGRRRRRRRRGRWGARRQCQLDRRLPQLRLRLGLSTSCRRRSPVQS
jgi:hypothetical protein